MKICCRYWCVKTSELHLVSNLIFYIGTSVTMNDQPWVPVVLVTGFGSVGTPKALAENKASRLQFESEWQYMNKDYMYRATNPYLMLENGRRLFNKWKGYGARSGTPLFPDLKWVQVVQLLDPG